MPVAALLGAFWALPFVWRRDYMNDMGWEKIQPWSNYPLWSTDWWGRVGDSLWPWDLRVAWLLALVGIVGGIAGRKRPHLFLGIMTALAGVAFVLLPQSRLWNARLLPFYYLGIYLLAALGIVEIVRSLVLRFADSRPVVAQQRDPGRSRGGCARRPRVGRPRRCGRCPSVTPMPRTATTGWG